MEDKAAFLNKMEKAGTPLDTNNIKDNELEGYFTVSSSDLKQQQNIKTILDQSSGIDTATMNENNVEKVKVNRLKKGDILSGTNVEVVWVGQTIQTPKGKTRVDIKYPSGNVVSKYWTTNTLVGIIKKDENLKTENKMEENKKQVSKNALKEMIRQEYQNVLAEKKKEKEGKEKLDENDMQIDESLSGAESLIAGILGLGIPLTALITIFVKTAIKKGGKQAAQELSNAISKATQADQ